VRSSEQRPATETRKAIARDINDVDIRGTLRMICATVADGTG